MANSTLEKVREIICDVMAVEPDRVVADARFVDDLGADSLDAVEIVMACEEVFGRTIPDEDAERLLKVGQLVEYLDRTEAEE